MIENIAKQWNPAFEEMMVNGNLYYKASCAACLMEVGRDGR